MYRPVESIDYGPLDKTLTGLEAVLNHRRAHPKQKSDEHYYEFLVNVVRSVRYAKEEGKTLVATTALIPTEILYAMDIVPMALEFLCGMVTEMTKSYEERFSTAKASGFAPEICSIHRIINAYVLDGILPKPDAVVWSNQFCDNTAKGGDCLMEVYGCPGFYLDRPYRQTEMDVRYLVGELEQMIAFLEQVTGRKLDWDRLKEAVKVSQRSLAISREIAELRKAVPSPVKWRTLNQLNASELVHPGSSAGVLKWYEAVRDEVKANVEQGKGIAPAEKYRLIQLFLAPFYMMNVSDWMEQHGAVSVMEPYMSTWGPGELDPEKPLESLARKTFWKPMGRQMHGPVEEGVLFDTLHDAVEYKANGAIFWAHIGCRQACACIKMIKDRLMEEVGIPTLVVDMDLYDSTYSSPEQVKDKLEGFFEVLDDRM